MILSGLAVGALVVGTGAAMMILRGQRAAVAEYQAVTYRRGVVSSARFAHDGQSFVYSASWEGRQYGIFLGRPESPDVRDLGLEMGRILSISRTGEMAVLFGSQNIQQAFGVQTLARVPLAGGARRDLLEGVVDADWIPGTDRLAVIRDPGGGRGVLSSGGDRCRRHHPRPGAALPDSFRRVPPGPLNGRTATRCSGASCSVLVH